MEKKYVLEVQLTPQIHEGNMAFYWHVDQITENGRYNVRDGWERSYTEALAYAYAKTKDLI